MKVINFILVFFSFTKTESLTLRKPVRKTIEAFHGGLELGLTTLTTGLIMDNTISKNSLNKIKNTDIKLYNQGMRNVVNNLILLGPCYYYGVDNFIISDHISNINLIETFNIVLILKLW